MTVPDLRRLDQSRAHINIASTSWSSSSTSSHGHNFQNRLPFKLSISAAAEKKLEWWYYQKIDNVSR